MTVVLKVLLPMLINDGLNITETAYRTVYSVPTNYTRAFTKHFGATPTDYLRDIK